MARTGPCISCGLLSRFPPAPNLPQEYLQVTPEGRTRLELAGGTYRFGSMEVHTNVVCFLRCPEFGATIDGNALRADPASYLSRLSEDRGCKEWIQFVPALDPKEHWHRQQMIDWREAEQAAQRRERRAERRARRREGRMERRARRREFLIVGALTVAQLLAAALLAYWTATPGSKIYDRWIKVEPTVPRAAPPTPKPQ